MFLGRKNERQQLQDFFDVPQTGAACLYGRQGVGKTSLLKDFLSDKEHIYFTAYATTGGRLAAMLARVAGVRASRLSDAETPAAQMEILLDEIGSKRKEKLVFVIDHYPHFAKADPSFAKLLHLYLTEKWTDAPVKLILCGDSYLQMQKLVLDKKALWQDVLSLRMELTGMGYYEAREFFPEGTDHVTSAVLYGMTGGIPCHLKRTAADIEASVYAVFFPENDEQRLLSETTIQSELREMPYYNHILETLAGGYNRVNQVSALVGKPKDVVVPYMNTLMSLGVVTKENPVTEKTNRKKTRYSIVNTFDLFWYRFFAPHMELYYEGECKKLYKDVVAPGWNAFMETVFISMCREYLEAASERGSLPFVIHEIGNWWQNDDEKHISEGFDLVAVGETEGEDAMMFARCYYSDQPVGIAILKDLIDLTKQVKGKKNVFYLVFSKSGFHENTTTVAATIKNIILISLEDICGI